MREKHVLAESIAQGHSLALELQVDLVDCLVECSVGLLLQLVERHVSKQVLCFDSIISHQTRVVSCQNIEDRHTDLQ